MDGRFVEALTSLEKSVATLSTDALPDVIGHLARLQALATLRLASSASVSAVVPDDGDKLLDVEAASKLLGLSPAQLARRRNLPFRRVLGRKTIRYSSAGIARWLARKQT